MVEPSRRTYRCGHPFAGLAKRNNALVQGLARADRPALRMGLGLAHAIADLRDSQNSVELYNWS